MNSLEAGSVEIRIGALVEHESERSALREIVRLLETDGWRALVVANFEIEGRQIDLFVARDDLALVIEAKGFTRAVRGRENGPWEVLLGSGRWKEFRNPYRQTLEAAFVVKRGARSFAHTGVPFIEAALVFSSGIPPGSEALQSNGKVTVIAQNRLGDMLRTRRQGLWSVDEWSAFADHLRLTRVSSVEAACDPGLGEAEERLRRYSSMFRQHYGDPETLVPFSCDSEGVDVPSSGVMRAVAEEGGVLLQGPSGCGKTMLAWASGVAVSERGGVVIVMQAKDFVGSARQLLRHETGLLGMPSAVQLLEDARQLNRAVLFIVDGYNECGEDQRRLLTRVIAALAYRYEAGVLVTSQVPLAREGHVTLRKFEVRPPGIETKRAIAEHASDGKVASDVLEPLLAAVLTGLEARLVGEVGNTVAPGSSRYALFDAFVRERLGRGASAGIRILSMVAAWLFERFAFSLSIREFDRLMDERGVPADERRLVLDKGLLTSRGDRVSFPHEMFLDAFAAEAVVRRACGSPEPVLQALAAPLHRTRKDLIIGAIDDDTMLEALLSRLQDSTSILACLQGRCGRHARDWAEEHCRGLWPRIRKEAADVRFRVDPERSGIVEFDESRTMRWSPCDWAFLGALLGRIAQGLDLEHALDIVGILDRRIAEETVRLHGETGTGTARLRSRMFELSFVHPQRSLGAPSMSIVCSRLGNVASVAGTERVEGLLGARPDGLCRDLVGRELSQGQTYLYLKLCGREGIPASFLSRTIEVHWDCAAYHLRLALMHCAALHCDAEDEAERERLIALIEGLLPKSDVWLNSSVLDALQRLGALDDAAQQHRLVVRRNIEDCLAHPGDGPRQAEAWGIYTAQFDHPYSDAFCDELAALADCDRKTLFEMASKGAKAGDLSLGCLLLDLAALGDPAVGESIARWTVPPPRDNRTFPQGDMHAFVVAHIALARLGCSLPEPRDAEEDPALRALNACGAILYWSNREDLDEGARLRACKPELAVLAEGGKSAALDVLRVCEDVSRDSLELLPGSTPVVRSVAVRFPSEAAAISRDALRDPDGQNGYFLVWSRSDQQPILEFGIRVLASFGKDSDRSLLRTFASDEEHGSSAIAALKAIEARSGGET